MHFQKVICTFIFANIVAIYYLYSVCYLVVPTMPKLLKVMCNTDATVNLSWIPPDPPNGIITQYQLQYRRSDSSDYTCISMSITNADLNFTVTGLTSNNKYVYRVRAFTSVGLGPPSNEVTVHLSKLH